ncbi:MAG: winged helix-turn-helix domain-containing protein [Marinicellaceae bacterium]
MSNIIEFENFRVDQSTRKIFKHEKQVNIQKKPYELLLYLIEHKDRAISKDELINEVWNGSIVTDSTLSHAIFKLRSSLRDNKGKEKIIRTARGFGFQFIAEIKSEVNKTNIEASKVKNNTFNPKYILISLVLALFGYFAINKTFYPVDNSNKTIVENQTTNTSRTIAFVTKTEIKDEQWLFQSLTYYMNQLMAYSENSNSQLLLLMNNDKQYKPSQAIENENKILASFDEKNVSLSFNSNIASINVPMNNIPDAVKSMNLWVCENVLLPSNDCSNQLNELTNDNAFIIENYLRGVNSYHNDLYEKAINYFNICLQEDSNFKIARFELAKSYFSLSQYTKAIAQLQTIISTATNQRLINQSYILLGKSYFRTSEYKKSEESFLKIIDNTLVDNNLRANAMIEIAQVYQENSDLSTAFSYVSKGNTILKDRQFPQLLARSYKIMGSIKNAQGNLEESEKFLILALNLYEDLNELNGIESVLSQLGSIFQANGELNTSLAYATRRQAIVERLGDPIGIAGSHLQLSYLLIEIGDLDKATFHANKMWEIAAKAQEPRAQMMASLILGEISSAKNYAQQSLDHYRQALEISRELGLKNREIIMLCNMGKVAIDGALYDTALESLNLCMTTADKAEYTLFQSVARLYLGELYRKKDLIFKSENQLKDAIEIANTMQNDDIKKGIQLEYFYLYITHDLAKAEHHLQLVPDNFKNSFLFLIAKSELEYKKQNTDEAYNVIMQAKQLAGDNWSEEDQALFENIRGEI